MHINVWEAPSQEVVGEAQPVFPQEETEFSTVFCKCGFLALKHLSFNVLPGTLAPCTLGANHSGQ